MLDRTDSKPRLSWEGSEASGCFLPQQRSWRRPGSLHPNVGDSALSSGWKPFDYVPQRNGGRKAVEFLSRHSKFCPGNSGLGAKILVRRPSDQIIISV